MIVIDRLNLDIGLNSLFNYNLEVTTQLQAVNKYAKDNGIENIVILGIGVKPNLSYDANLRLNESLDANLNYSFVLLPQEAKEQASTDLITNLTKHNIKVYTSNFVLGKVRFEVGRQVIINFRKKKYKPLTFFPSKFDESCKYGYLEITDGKVKPRYLKPKIKLSTIRTSSLRKPKKGELVHLIVDTKEDLEKYQKQNVVRLTREGAKVSNKGISINFDLEAFINTWIENNELPERLITLRQELIA